MSVNILSSLRSLISVRCSQISADGFHAKDDVEGRGSKKNAVLLERLQSTQYRNLIQLPLLVAIQEEKEQKDYEKHKLHLSPLLFMVFSFRNNAKGDIL